MPYFGGKSVVAEKVWSRLGSEVGNFVDPFMGSNAMLLGRPGWSPKKKWVETVNDKDGYVANFFRALKADPDKVSHYADNTVNETDKLARHAWLAGKREHILSKLEGDPDWYNAKIAGWWVWGIGLWIGGGYCDGKGSWVRVKDANGDWRIEKKDKKHPDVQNGTGVCKQVPHLSGKGMGVTKQIVSYCLRGVNRNLDKHTLTKNAGTGECGLYEWMLVLASRLEKVRVCCGDWKRVLTPAVTTGSFGTTAIFFDPPYSNADRSDVYSNEDYTVARKVRKWCKLNGGNEEFRIALCGYAGEGHEVLESMGWEVYRWEAAGGYGNQGDGAGVVNKKRESIWFSPHCLKEYQSWKIFQK